MNVQHHFGDRIVEAVANKGNPVCVGLDPRVESLPAKLSVDAGASFEARAEAFRRFCLEIIDVVGPLVPVVKPQAAFFEQLGPPGCEALADVIRHARQAGLLVIFDGKRNDIGSTAAAYADAYLGEQSPWGADALTVSPYLGDDSLQPFVDTAQARGAGVFVLVKTSNPGGGLFQDVEAEGRKLYQRVAAHVETLAGATVGERGYGSVGAVVGATYPEQLEELRAAMPRTWFLVPGFGAQGAGAADTAPAFDAQGQGAVVNSSRGIIFAYSREPYRDRFAPSDWQAAVEAAARDMIQQLRAETPAGKLPG
ncbi:MAG: orotidine-5'-phosphate decarboxylase [Planctomycetales bacterium]